MGIHCPPAQSKLCGNIILWYLLYNVFLHQPHILLAQIGLLYDVKQDKQGQMFQLWRQLNPCV